MVKPKKGHKKIIFYHCTNYVKKLLNCINFQSLIMINKKNFTFFTFLYLKIVLYVILLKNGKIRTLYRSSTVRIF
ncbi:hypothetical protein BpHYR1_032254 [Brachionus plicatilis]|uniref:Uncharacterized protein n=1 Tax=Brachionus plicatilis TaxID=10195 RepID=A0A3M7PAU8_BRAPC|nr:hypothetical protein BpHYR1_032254 [Brachionus plicatilis]